MNALVDWVERSKGTRMFLNNINTDIVSRQGTAIGKAIRLAGNSFTQDAESNKAIIIISDGENHEPDAILAAEKAFKEHEVKVFTIGMGSTKGARVPVYDQNDRLITYKKDRDGNTVLSKLNENMLKEIAEAGKGKYTKAEGTNLGLNEIMDDINQIETTEFGTSIYHDFDDQYHWFILASIILFIPVLLIQNETLNKNKKINLFEV